MAGENPVYATPPSADDGEIIDISVPSSGRQPRVELQPYDPEKQRDIVRLVVTVGLLTMLLIVVVWACGEAASWPDHWNQTKEMLQIILPALVGLIGSVIGFYFGSSKVGGSSPPKNGS